MKTKIPHLILAALTTGALVGSANAALVVTNGGFDSPALVDGAQSQDPGSWYDSSDTWSSYTIHNSTEIPIASEVLVINGGWVHQSLGTRSAGEKILSVTYDAFERTNRSYGDVVFDVYAGTFSPANDNDDVADEGLTLLGSFTVTSADLGFTQGSVDQEVKLGHTAGAVDLTGAAVGTQIWLRISESDSGTSSGQPHQGFIENLSVTAVPEPSSTALLGLGGLALVLRRKRS